MKQHHPILHQAVVLLFSNARLLDNKFVFGLSGTNPTSKNY